MPVSINTAALKYRDQQGTYQSIASIKGDNGAIGVVAPAYEDLTYPVTAGQGCIYNDLYYVAKQDITTQEEWTSIHWEQKSVNEEIKELKENPEFINSISLGRKEGTVIGQNSVAIGMDVEANGMASYAEGYHTISGIMGHSEGLSTVSAVISHAEGQYSFAGGNSAHAEGIMTAAIGSGAHAEGASGGSNSYYLTKTANSKTYVVSPWTNVDESKIGMVVIYKDRYGYILSFNDNDHTITLSSSLSYDLNNERCMFISGYASGANSHIEGYGTIANSVLTHASGRYNQLQNIFANWVSGTVYEVGDKVINYDSGYECIIANNDSTFDRTKWRLIYTTSDTAFVIGNGVDHANRSNALMVDWNGNERLAGDVYVHCNSDSTGGEKLAKQSEVLFEAGSKAGAIQAKGITIGGRTYQSIASGIAAFAMGVEAMASAQNAVALGQNTTASGSASYAEGVYTIASGANSHAEGQNTEAAGGSSHAQGMATRALGKYSHAAGYGTVANAMSQSALGAYNIQSTLWPSWIAGTEYSVGDKVLYSVYAYECIEANSDSTWTRSKWKMVYKSSDQAVIVGNGTGDNARSNAYALDWDGTGHFSGDVYVHCNADSTGGTKLIEDVKVNGSSVVTDGVANVPKATTTQYGVSRYAAAYGISASDSWDTPRIYKATDGFVKAGEQQYTPITPYNQHGSTFYGLAKAAGDSTQASSSNAVGNYTESAKSAISQMLDAPETISGTTPSITAKAGVRYICGECSTLTIVAPASGCIDVTFTSGSTPTILTVTPPTGLTMKWANGFDPTALEANTIYEINIMDGCLGVAGSWT